MIEAQTYPLGHFLPSRYVYHTYSTPNDRKKLSRAERLSADALLSRRLLHYHYHYYFISPQAICCLLHVSAISVFFVSLILVTTPSTHDHHLVYCCRRHRRRRPCSKITPSKRSQSEAQPTRKELSSIQNFRGRYARWFDTSRLIGIQYK